MATAKSSTSKKSRSTSDSRSAKGGSKTGSGKNAAAKSGTAKKSASKSASRSNQGGNRSATAKTGGAKKTATSKSSAMSKTGASKSAGTAKKAGSKSSTARSASASRSGGSKTSTANKSGAAGKRTASGGAKQSSGSRSTGSKKTPANGKSKSASKRAANKAGNGGIIERVTNAVTGLFSSGKPNAIDMLTADHRVVDGYFQKVKANEDANHLETYKKIRFELDAHAHVEETIFYPYLLEHGDKELQKIVREGVEEHRQMKLFLAELDELSGDNERFKAKLKVLMEDVEHHVQEEEDEMFAMAEDQIPREVLEKLGEQMEKEKARFQKRASSAKASRASANR